MATSKPRITVSLTPETYELIRRLSYAQHVSMSSVVSEMMDMVIPSLERVVGVFEAAMSVPKQERSNILRMASKAQISLESALQEMEEELALPPYANRGVNNGESST